MTDPKATHSRPWTLTLGAWAKNLATELDDPCYYGGDDPDAIGSIAAAALIRLLEIGDEAGLRTVHAVDVKRREDLARLDARLNAEETSHNDLAARYDEQKVQTLSADCTHCGAQPGKRCRTVPGGWETEPHAARRAAGREAS